jgi:hypothetical protein
MASSRVRPEGPATVFAIGTVVPPTVHEQSTYPDYYFEATNCNHKTELKAKFKRICESQFLVQFACKNWYFVLKTIWLKIESSCARIINWEPELT